jgi:uncharacterized integral membrane protein
MNPSNSTSREYALDASQEDGVRPVSAEAESVTADATDTGPNEVIPATGHRVVDTPAPLPDPSPPVSDTSVQERAADAASSADRAPRLTRASAAWAAVIAALLLSIVLIVFVLQNPTTVVINFLGWSGTIAVGMAMLIAAVTGGLVVATIGVARLTQLRVRARRTRPVTR